jgi:hypothetical protein
MLSKNIAIAFLCFLISNTLNAQNNFWSHINANEINTSGNEILPQKYLAYQLNITELDNQLQAAPMEFTSAATTNALILDIPMPNGDFQKFAIVKSPIMAPALAAQFNSIQTYSGQGITDPHAVIRLDITDWGFHAMVLSPNGVVFIDPSTKQNNTDYIVYYKHDYINKTKAAFKCEGVLGALNGGDVKSGLSGICIGSQLRKYRLAVACTFQYAQAVCGGTATTSGTLSAITTTINRVVGVYELEVAVRLELVANEANIIYLNSSDPFSSNANSNPGTLINESQTIITSNIGSTNFDIGHTFSTGGGGLAQLGCVCNTSNKARGITGSGNPTGDPYDIDYVAHEMGHQFGGNHTFNSNFGSCTGNRNASTAYEVGSGTSIMAYAGICDNSQSQDDNIQPNSDANFHTISFDEIALFTNSGGGNNCAVIINTANNAPSVTMPSNIIIPKSTPFILIGSATDINGDALTYSWEEMDKGASTTWNGGANSTSAPIIKSRIPTIDSKRYIPSLANINAGLPVNPTGTIGGLKGETLPTVGRIMNFRLTVRDNNNGGGGVATGGNGCSSTAPFTVTVDGNAGPFIENIPNGGENWTGGTSQTVTWTVANTNTGAVNCATVNIYMSIDGGISYNNLIASNLPNNGSAAIITPNVSPTNTTVRYLIRGTTQPFFDVSNANFTISNNPSLPSWTAVNKVNNSSQNITLFPNPTTSVLTINFDQNNTTFSSFYITNSIGQIVSNGQIELNATKSNVSVNNIIPGIYFIHLMGNTTNQVLKFIKQ